MIFLLSFASAGQFPRHLPFFVHLLATELTGRMSKFLWFLFHITDKFPVMRLVWSIIWYSCCWRRFSPLLLFRSLWSSHLLQSDLKLLAFSDALVAVSLVVTHHSTQLFWYLQGLFSQSSSSHHFGPRTSFYWKWLRISKRCCTYGTKLSVLTAIENERRPVWRTKAHGPESLACQCPPALGAWRTPLWTRQSVRSRKERETFIFLRSSLTSWPQGRALQFLALRSQFGNGCL